MTSIVAALIGLGVGIIPLLPSLIGKRERPSLIDYLLMGGVALSLSVGFALLASSEVMAAQLLADLTQHGWLVMGVFCLIYFCVMLFLSLREVKCFVPDIADLGVFEQGFWTTCRGAFFFSSLTANDVDFVPASELLKGPRAFSLFGGHFSPILILLLPIYRLFKRPETLVVLQSLALSVAPLLIYWEAIHLAGPAAALLIALAFAFGGPMIGSFLLGWHEISFATVPLLLAYHFLDASLFGPFLLCLVLACMIKESVTLTVFLFGPLALLRGYEAVWWLTPMLLGLGWFLVAVRVFSPFFALGRPYIFFHHRYKALGGSLPQILRTFVLTPWKVIRIVLRTSNLKYLYQLLFPYGLVLPFAHVAMLPSLAGLGQVLLSDGNQYALPYKYYSLEAFIFLTLGFAGTLGNLEHASGTPFPLAFVVSLGAVALSIDSLILWSRGILWSKQKGNFFKRRPNHEALQEVLHLIPKDAPALVPLSLVTSMAQRTQLGQESWNYEPGVCRHYEYIVIDHNDQWRFGRQDKVKHESLKQEVANTPEFTLIYERDGVQVFQQHRNGSTHELPST